MFEERPSRPEDLNTIEMLHNEILQRDQAIAKMKE